VRTPAMFLLVVSLAACAPRGSTTPARPASAVDFALDGLPREARFLVGVDVTRLAATPVGARLIEALGTVEVVNAYASLGAACPLHASDFGLLVIGGDNGEDNRMSMLARTAIAERTAVTCVEALMQQKSGTVAHVPVAGRVAYHTVGSGTDDSWFAAAGPGRLAIADGREWLARTIDPAAPHARQNAALAAAAARVDASAPLWLAMVLFPSEQAALVLASGGKLEQAPSAVAISAQVSTSLSFELAATFADAAHAVQASVLASALVADWREAAKGSPFEAVLAHVTVSVSGTQVVARVVVDAQATDVIVSGLVSGIISTDDDEDTGAAGDPAGDPDDADDDEEGPDIVPGGQH
jgi:hypothetical protein